MAEDPETRAARLSIQAARMRDARAKQEFRNHKCRISDTDAQLFRLYTALDTVARDNIAPVPIALTLEDDKWLIDVHVHVKGVTEYEFTTSGDTLATALSHATKSLGNHLLVPQAAASNAIFGIEV